MAKLIKPTDDEVRLADEAKRLRAEAATLKPGAARDALIRKARQAETGSHIMKTILSRSVACL